MINTIEMNVLAKELLNNALKHPQYHILQLSTEKLKDSGNSLIF